MRLRNVSFCNPIDCCCYCVQQSAISLGFTACVWCTFAYEFVFNKKFSANPKGIEMRKGLKQDTFYIKGDDPSAHKLL